MLGKGYKGQVGAGKAARQGKGKARAGSSSGGRRWRWVGAGGRENNAGNRTALESNQRHR